MTSTPKYDQVNHELPSKEDMEAAIADCQRENASTIIIPDRQLEKKVVHKLDLRLAPMFAVLYFVAYLDRSNIGNAAIVGLTEDLHLTGSQFSTAASVFFATYVAFQIPVVLAMKKLKPSRAITMMVIGWSTITIGTAFVKNYGQLVAVRLLLGFCEAGFFPTLSLYITMVYKREEQGRRIAYLFGSVALAGMFGGLFATGITKIGHAHGLNAWSWLYLIEGCVSFVAAAWPEEKEVMLARDRQRLEYLGSLNFEWVEVGRALKDPKVWLCCLIQFFQDIILYGFSTFLPSILKLDLNFNAMEAQYLSVPVYLLGGIVFFTAAIMGDKYKLRGTFLGILDIFAVVGYAILLGVSNSPGARYFACYLIAIPIYCGPGLNEIWINNNMAPHYRRATAIGLQQTIGNIAGVVAPQVYRAAPYRLGHWCSLGSAIICIVLITLKILYLRALNRKKEQISSGEREDDRKETTGEGALDFRYIY
uniref:Major facilitator superfamily (MFS) profile domain-containing protein n=1 Tax=Bionectria ochroleuca TaxID=29856 RepID=A0A8H7K8H4_BIOOC